VIYICIPVFDRIERTQACLRSIGEQSCQDVVVILCDHSLDGTIGQELKRMFSEIVVLRGDSSMWWTAATNQCVTYALEQGNDGDYVFTLNNDTILEPDCISVLLATASADATRILGCVNLLQSDGEPRIEPSAQVRYSLLGLTMYRNADAMGSLLADRNGVRPVDTLSGKGVLVPFTVFRQIGVYNEMALPHYHADTEFSVRATRYGYNLFVHYGARLYSWHEETGLNARNTSSDVAAFFRGFGSVKSTRHLPSLVSLNRLLYGWTFPLYLLLNLAGITGGFLRRFFRNVSGLA
jgi:GT2 family glycosyltransferase